MWHSPALPCAQRADEAAALPSPPGYVVPTAQAVLRPPPTPSRHPSTSRLITGYRTGTLRRNTTQPPGRVGPPQFPPPPSERSEPHTPGGPSGLQSRIYTPSMAFAVTIAARLLLFPTRRRGRSRRGRLRFTLRTAQSLPQQGFRRWASTRPVTRPSRQPATGPPDSYPDGTHTRWRRRAYVGLGHLNQPPPTLGAHRSAPGAIRRVSLDGVTASRAKQQRDGAVSIRGSARASDPWRALG